MKRERNEGNCSWFRYDQFAWWLIPVIFATLVLVELPLKTGLQFGGDEGYELIKGLLVSHGSILYRDVWNDQPALHTALLAGLFSIFGPSAYVGRLLTVAFAVLLLMALYRLVRLRLGRFAGTLALVLILGSSGFVLASVSVMLELPAMALSLMGVACLYQCFLPPRFGNRAGRRWLVLSGASFGAAFHLKFTSAIFWPATIWEILRFRDSKEGFASHRHESRALNLLFWLVSALGTSYILSLLLYSVSPVAIFKQSHFASSQAAVFGDSAMDVSFRLVFLFYDY